MCYPASVYHSQRFPSGTGRASVGIGGAGYTVGGACAAIVAVIGEEGKLNSKKHHVSTQTHRNSNHTYLVVEEAWRLAWHLSALV